MSNRGELSEEIQRRSAEIDSWPRWAQPFDPGQAPQPGRGEAPTPFNPVPDAPPRDSCERERDSNGA